MRPIPLQKDVFNRISISCEVRAVQDEDSSRKATIRGVQRMSTLTEVTWQRIDEFHAINLKVLVRSKWTPLSSMLCDSLSRMLWRMLASQRERHPYRAKTYRDSVDATASPENV